MKRDLIKLPEMALRDEADMRAFYESCGMRKHTIDAAINAIRNRPVVAQKMKPPAFKGRRKVVRSNNPVARELDPRSASP